MKQKNQTTGSSSKPTAEQIATAAYHLYAESGYHNGHDQEHWLRAEELLSQKLKPASKVGVAEANSNRSSQPVEIQAQPKAAAKQPAPQQPQWRPEPAAKQSTPATRAA